MGMIDEKELLKRDGFIVEVKNFVWSYPNFKIKNLISKV